MLSDSESGVDDVHQLTLNEHFAKAYAYKKEREELSNLKDKYGSDLEEGGEVSEDSEEDTTEDEEGEELTPAVDAAILRTLARIKRKDPAIYEVDKDVFEDSKAEEQQKTKGSFSFNTQKDKHKSKPLLMRQHVLNSTIKSTSRSPSPSPAEPTHAQEQAELRKETISAFHSALAGDGTAEDEDDILIPREKTKDEIEREQEEYREFLTREVGEDISGLVTVEEGGNVKMNVEDEDGDEGTEDVAEESEKKKKKKKKTKGKKTKEEADHEFLMNYILGRGWIDHSTRHVPTYNEVTDSRRNEDEDGAGRVRIVSVKSSLGEDAEGDGDFDEEEFDEVLDTFESSYNFRFEEPDAFKIPAHPRTIDSTVRREENPRKEARERKKQRKEEKILQKREEVKRLKALKMKEIREKLERIGKEGGKSIDDEALAQLDLDGDWDPDAYDTQMKGIYGGEDESELGEDDVDLEKPSWDDDIDITNVIPTAKNDLAGPSTSKKKKKKDKKKKNGDADEDGVDIDMMDADFLGVEGNDFEEGASTSKQKRKELDAHMDDVYGLEFNDMVGDMPTRFKYMPVLPQTYGLDPVEILLADDADLNNVVGLRTLAPYRRDKGRTWDANRSEKLQELRSQLREKRNFAVGSGGTNTKWSGSGVQNEEEERPAKKRKGKKERLKAKATSTEATEDTSGVGDATDDVKRPQ
ncbi:hypothetical protein EW145_g3091 [Phellinidium pouzarii]|uniref:Kri1-like C-terminal domain-containing protein n=1 Tax=Phellinidium pouzarii TaxID=167371 RepID=A0A4S4LAC7_9AGAM|nr:hypothetical protein EW145_g3091 [Phellinidium pouzarii]